MTAVINSPRINNSGTLRGPIFLGEGKNYFDNRDGIVTGKVSALGGNDTFLGGVRSEYVDGGAGNDKLDGGIGNDRLMGGSGNDRLYGGVGNDKLTGGAGKDQLVGGDGRDAFVFSAEPVAANTDLIRDFNPLDDTIQIARSIFTALARKGKLAKDAFHLGSKAKDAEDRIVYHKAKGAVYYDPDGTGPEAQVNIAVIANKAALSLSDFVVI
jgi:serralysin